MFTQGDCVNCSNVVNVIDEGQFYHCNNVWTGELYCLYLYKLRCGVLLVIPLSVFDLRTLS